MPSRPNHADPLEMQHRLFAELSRMFGEEVPLYDKSLEVNAVCNRAVCDLLALRYEGLHISDERLAKTSAERHGAIRIGRADEFRWIGRFFARFAMEPHNFYALTSVGAKSQPVISTAFRSVTHPEHRVFSSLLRTDFFDSETAQRLEGLLEGRRVFSDEAKALIEKAEREGGLCREDAEALIREGTARIFKWTGEARDHGLYTHLCDSGFKIAADIACFGAHHLNHLTPNTLCMDLFTSAMKWRMGEIDASRFRDRAHRALERTVQGADRDTLRLLFKHLTRADAASFGDRTPGPEAVGDLVDRLVEQLSAPAFDLTTIDHNGFKDSTEGPSWDTPILLRQDAYRALSERVLFTNNDGSTIEAVHTARFGEIEQRAYATTVAGRAMYDACLANAQRAESDDPGLAHRDIEAYENAYASFFERFPKTLPELLEQGLVYACYEPTDRGLASRESIETTDLCELVRLGYVACEGLRYEDFLPVSAAGIFASNLNQYGTRSTAQRIPTHTQDVLEEVLGRPIIDADAVYRGMQADSILRTYEALGLTDRLDAATREQLEADGSALPNDAASTPTSVTEIEA